MNDNKGVMVSHLINTQALIAKTTIKTDSSGNKVYTLEDPLGVRYSRNPEIDPSEDRPFEIIDVLALSADHTIDIDGRHVVYTHAAHPVIVEQYNRVVLTRLQAIPDNDEEENSEFIDNWS